MGLKGGFNHGRVKEEGGNTPNVSRPEPGVNIGNNTPNAPGGKGQLGGNNFPGFKDDQRKVRSM